MTITRTANAAQSNARNTSMQDNRARVTSHLVFDNDTGRLVGLQHSLFLLGRHYATTTTPVL